MAATIHVIRMGDTLSSIARQYGAPGWQSIYFAAENEAFRQRYPDPDKLHPGIRLVIPTEAVAQRRTIEERLRRLHTARDQAQELFRQQSKELEECARAIKRTADNVDTAATVATLLLSLGQLTHQASKVLRLDGQALKAANKEFLKDFAKDRVAQARDLSATVVAAIEDPAPSVLWLVTKAVAQAWCDMGSPSFWANTVVQLFGGQSWSTSVTRKPDDVVREAAMRLRNTEQDVLRQIDTRIRETNDELLSIGTRK